MDQQATEEAFPTDGKGDCEDYALLNRHELMQLGWPSNALLMTVVIDENGEGHAVLAVRTEVGDLILDNNVNDVHLWTETRYRFVLRQSFVDPRSWAFLDQTRRGPDTHCCCPPPTSLRSCRKKRSALPFDGAACSAC